MCCDNEIGASRVSHREWLGKQLNDNMEFGLEWFKRDDLRFEYAAIKVKLH